MTRQFVTIWVIIVLFCSIFLAVPVKIKTVPGNTSVYINNTLFGITDRTGILSEMLFLMEGDYTFKAEKPGYNTLEEVITISEATSIRLEMIPSGVLSIEVFPENSQIIVNEQYETIGTFERELPVGKHYIQVSHEGYIPRTFYLDVKQYSKRYLQVTLEQEGKTKIFSDPSGALVSIDGNKIGETPIETYIDAGKHIISFHKEWHYSETLDVEIEKEGLNEITQILQPFSNITIEASPSDTLISFDNYNTSKSPLNIKQISPGKYPLTLTAEGYEPVQKEMIVEIGENTFNEELSLKRYPWTFASTPAAVLTVDGKEIGLTPVELMLTHGEHLFRLDKGEKEWMTKMEVDDSGSKIVNLNDETTILFNILPAGQSFVIHRGMEYESPAIINTNPGMQTFDIVRGGYPTRRRLYKLLPGKIYEETINLEGESELFLVTKPPSAEVYWMGAYIGDTPLRGVKIRPGSGSLKLIWSDGAKYEETITFLDGETYTIYREIPAYTKLKINSLPNQLEIFLDGKSSGVTPVTLNLKQGTYSIRCEKENGEIQEKVISLNGQRERTINFIF
ncbi:MAG: PEGA domain-containing protein [bacterium]